MRGMDMCELAPRERVEAALRRLGGEPDNAEQRDAEAEGGEDQVLPRRLERTRLPAEADEQRRRSGRSLDEEPGSAEVSHQRDRGQDRPEEEEERIVGPWSPGGPHEPARRRRRQVRRRNENAREADDADHADE